jgi:hypothetical protein
MADPKHDQSSRALLNRDHFDPWNDRPLLVRVLVIAVWAAIAWAGIFKLFGLDPWYGAGLGLFAAIFGYIIGGVLDQMKHGA